MEKNLLKNSFKLLSYNTFIPFVYDPLMYLIKKERQRALELLEFTRGEKVLIPGVGMGHDLPYIPADVEVEGIDLSDVMLSGATLRAKNLNRGNVALKVMDAEALEYPDNYFDKAVLILFLTVVYDPKKVLSEVARVMKPGGKILVLDHFVRSGLVPAPVLSILENIMKLSFTSFSRVFEEIAEGQGLSVVSEFSSKIPGFSIYVLRKDDH